jgi:SAM-dependent methyltransferase
MSPRPQPTRKKNDAPAWDDVHHFSPAPRHRRRLILRLLAPLTFETCLDVGCAQPYLLEDLAQQGKKVFGCDLSAQVVRANRRRLPQAGFAALDITAGVYPGRRSFDLVMASEVLEHVSNWPTAVRNLCRMAKRYVLITVPGGKVYPIDRLVGHRRHFTGPELRRELERRGFRVVQERHWGFPWHSVYKTLINVLAPRTLYARFGTARYGFGQKLVSQFLYALFFSNDWFASGQQIVILAERS